VKKINLIVSRAVTFIIVTTISRLSYLSSVNNQNPMDFVMLKSSMDLLFLKKNKDGRNYY
jgi:hypothetical protein